MDDGLDATRALLPGWRLKAVDTLSDGERSSVRRVAACDPDGAESTLIVKQFHATDEGWLRESAALESVPGAVRVPALIAVGPDPQIIVMEDLGDGMGVSAALVADDPQAAADAVVGWAEAIAELHVATRASRNLFRTALERRRGDVDVAESWMPGQLREAERNLDRHCGSLGVTVPAGAFAELTGLIDRLGGETVAALTPGDICPDNNVRMGERCVLVDFEGAQWQHVAWDIAYLRVPWPTCWCSWRIPDSVADRAVEAYRGIAAGGFPEVGSESFERDVDAAVVGWCLMSAAFSLDVALGTEIEIDHQLDPDRPIPRRRALLMHRLARAARSTELPALAELATGLHEELRSRWGDVHLELAPAFRRE